jgi:enterochelin esterase-like enzyme
VAYSIYLPKCYANSNLRYPVIYLLHGSGGDEYQWINGGKIDIVAELLIKKGELPPSIKVYVSA